MFSPDEVESLNGFQNSRVFHPFTCGSGNRCDAKHLDGEGLLVAKEDGWHCPFCEYRQDWAYGWMKNWEWKKLHEHSIPWNWDFRNDSVINCAIEDHNAKS